VRLQCTGNITMCWYSRPARFVTWLFLSVFATALPSHTEGVVGLLDAAEGFPYGAFMNLFNFVDQSLTQTQQVLL